MAYFAPRKARTSLPCLECGKPLNIERSCLETYMACPHCNKKFPLMDFIAKADKPMEVFLENVYCDRS